MGFYNCYNIECIVKPEYIEIIQDFINNGYQWNINDDVIYDCLKDWMKFLRKNGHAIISSKEGVMHKYCIFAEYRDEKFLNSPDYEIFYYNSPPSGLPSRWGQYCELIKNDNNTYTWKFTGEMKDYNNEITFFLHKVLVVMSSNIYQCWLSNEDTDYIYDYSNDELRSYRPILC